MEVIWFFAREYRFLVVRWRKLLYIYIWMCRHRKDFNVVLSGHGRWHDGYDRFALPYRSWGYSSTDLMAVTLGLPLVVPWCVSCINKMSVLRSMHRLDSMLSLFVDKSSMLIEVIKRMALTKASFMRFSMGLVFRWWKDWLARDARLLYECTWNAICEKSRIH